MYYFCTYFDQHYLTRGLALYYSLRTHCPAFKLWVLCMDHMTYEVLRSLELPGLHPIALDDFERDDEALRNSKQNRSKIEYYFTCTPSLPLFILKNWPDVDLITYLDGDLFFFANATPLFEEIGSASVAIIPHRFAPHIAHLEKHGIYNVGWLSFRRDSHGLACLRWWRERCIEWCYDRVENERFADQKYLDDWPTRFHNVCVVKHKGANVALWNVGNYRLRWVNGTVRVGDQPLIFFHFHGVKEVTDWLYSVDWEAYAVAPSLVLRRKIFARYIAILVDMRKFLPFSVGLSRGIRYQTHGNYPASVSSIARLASWWRTATTLFRGLSRGRYMFVMQRHVI